MISETQSVSIDAIDMGGDALRITTRRDIDNLAASIRRLGLINAPLLKEAAAGYRVISGFRRIEACRRLQMPSVPARMVGADTSRRTCVELAVADNALQRPLNELELARCFRLLQSFYPSLQALTRAGRRLGLPQGTAYVRKLLALAEMGDDIQQAVGRGDISLSMVAALQKCTPPDASAVCALFVRLKPSLNKQREIYQLCREIALRDQMSISELLQEPGLKSILAATDVDANRKTALLRQALKKRRMPSLSRAREQFEREVKTLDLGKGLSLVPPAGFEGRTYRLNAAFGTLEDLRRHLDTLRKLVESPAMKRILERRHVSGD